MKHRHAIALLAACFGFVATSLAPLRAADDPPATPAIVQTPYQAPSARPRLTVFISDLHFGVGKTADGAWDATEDFRWPKALAGFLAKMSEDGQDRVDLVIVGDFLELWQPPADILCKGVSADIGCSIDEMAMLVGKVAAAHAVDLQILRQFAERGENRLHVIVGNHDSTLRYEPVWKTLGDALNANSGRVDVLTEGVWVSADGRMVAEHGNQIGQDVNKYHTWPMISRRVDGKDFIVRPWGELFVQQLFNSQERTYEIIDNLSPETAGARYRAADRGLWGSAADIAKMLQFNLLETSLKQKSVLLGKPPSGNVNWDIDIGRQMGASLFLYALPVDDPLRQQLFQDDAAAIAIKTELAALANDNTRLPDAEVHQLCDMIAARNSEHVCWNMQLGSLAQHFLQSKIKVMEKHLAARLTTYKSMRVFVYGHTHQSETPWALSPDGLTKISVANTGAFQRLLDETGFLKRLNGRTPQDALRTMTLDELPPCYTAVIVDAVADNGIPVAQTRTWFMPENAVGEMTTPDDARCE